MRHSFHNMEDGDDQALDPDRLAAQDSGNEGVEKRRGTFIPDGIFVPGFGQESSIDKCLCDIKAECLRNLAQALGRREAPAAFDSADVRNRNTGLFSQLMHFHVRRDTLLSDNTGQLLSVLFH